MAKHLSVLLLVAGAISAASACSSSSGGRAVECSPTGTCPGDLVCSQGFCVQPGTGGTGGGGPVSCTPQGSCPTGLVCQSNVCVSPGTGGTGGSAGADPVAPGKTPPAPNGGSPVSNPTPTVISVRELFVGDTDRSFAPSATAWQEFGYNIDGIISTKTGTNHCKPKEGTPKSKIQTDGADGVDNSYGANLVPIIMNLSASPSESATQGIQQGSYTFLFRLANLDSTPNQTNVNAAFYHGADLGTFPKFDGTDAWPVVPELLTNPNDIDSSLFQFPASYVANGVWVSGTGSPTLDVALGFGDGQMMVRLTHPIITMTIQPNGIVNDGIIAGVIPTEAFINEMKKVAGSFDPGLCEGPTFESIANQMRAASDIMQDGSNGNPNVECDGISVGLGFSGTAATLGGIAPATPPQPDPCTNP